MSMEHLFTVGTPTYNRKKLLKRLYESLKNQTFKDFVWLIVDDGSQDGTKEVVSDFISEGVLDIHYEYQENKGLYYVDKKLYSCITTKYYVGIDDDDELTPNCLETFKTEWGGFLLMYAGEYERPFPSVMIWRLEDKGDDGMIKDIRYEDGWIIERVWRDMLMPEDSDAKYDPPKSFIVMAKV